MLLQQIGSHKSRRSKTPQPLQVRPASEGGGLAGLTPPAEWRHCRRWRWRRRAAQRSAGRPGGTPEQRSDCSRRAQTPPSASSSLIPGGCMKITISAPSSASSPIRERSSIPVRRASQPAAKDTRQSDSRRCSPRRRRRLLAIPRGRRIVGAIDPEAEPAAEAESAGRAFGPPGRRRGSSGEYPKGGAVRMLPLSQLMSSTSRPTGPRGAPSKQGT